MTNKEIQKAAVLIDEISYLKSIIKDKDKKLVIAVSYNRPIQQQQYSMYPVAHIEEVDVRAILKPVLDSKISGLEKLRKC